MKLSDDQIRRFAERGDPLHAWYSYQMVRETLALVDLGDLSYEVYPQGSYANKTNIAGDSDVDLVIALKSAFYADKEDLSPLSSKNTKGTTSGPRLPGSASVKRCSRY